MKTVTLVTGPAAEPVTLDEAKQWAKIDSSDEEGQLATLLTAAIQSAEQYLKRSLISQTLKLSLDLRGNGLDSYLGEGVYDLPPSELYGGLPTTIRLSRGPVSAISSVATYDTLNASSTLSASAYVLSNDRLALNLGYAWPSNMRQFGACEITYVAGYGSTGTSVPQPIKQAVMMHFQRMYDSRIICEMPKGCQMLLNQYRVMDHA